MKISSEISPQSLPHLNHRYAHSDAFFIYELSIYNNPGHLF
ncbi:hypothetical Protein YC6258_03490 [Gynuella sunshinyii YC6258]|uniref:Uncharacterized protein n=1 Tax=Gynuella sunshinyii YC6258 TaxID=1445510 RepID=A0A0C5VMI3_9GAMM|nr:hypothetical Protein YC6258_03490 [Gynuella sunshinyii YC6258]